MEPYKILWNQPVHDELMARAVNPRHAFICDIDGTCARMDARGPFEWHRVGEDKPHQDVIDLLCILHTSGYHIIMVSGRDGACEDITFKWLVDHGVPFSALIMRQAKDCRSDAIIKHEIYDECVKPNWDVLGVFDDRDRVVAIWRELGLRCYQVAYGDF